MSKDKFEFQSKNKLNNLSNNPPAVDYTDVTPIHVYQKGGTIVSSDEGMNHAETLLNDTKSPTIKEIDSYLEQEDKVKHNSIASYENDALKGGSCYTHQAVINAHFGNLEGLSRKNTNKSIGK